MTSETRTVCYDSELLLEAYRFEGVLQKFPNHFHDYYVIGFIENGRRYVQCVGREYLVGAGDMVVFNPLDPHTCEQKDEQALDYRALNIRPDIMERAVFEITGKKFLPRFTQNVLYQSELAASLRDLHLMIMKSDRGLPKEELFFFLIEQLLGEYTGVSAESLRQECSVQSVCDYLESNYEKAVTLDELSRLAGLSKYYLLRTFTRQKGISPYSYLVTVRIGRSKKLLELGVPPAEAAHRTGFSDQSHFSNYFKRLIGLTPRQYMKIFTADLSPLSKEVVN